MSYYVQYIKTSTEAIKIKNKLIAEDIYYSNMYGILERKIVGLVKDKVEVEAQIDYFEKEFNIYHRLSTDYGLYLNLGVQFPTDKIVQEYEEKKRGAMNNFILAQKKLVAFNIQTIINLSIEKEICTAKTITIANIMQELDYHLTYLLYVGS